MLSLRIFFQRKTDSFWFFIVRLRLYAVKVFGRYWNRLSLYIMHIKHRLGGCILATIEILIGIRLEDGLSAHVLGGSYGLG